MTSSSEAPQAEQVTLAEAAEHLKVHYMTAYRYVRTGRMHAEKRGGKWWVAAADLEAVVAEGSGRRSPSPESANRANLIKPLVARLVDGDTAGCWDLICDALSSGATPSQIHTDLLNHALKQIGEGWQNGIYTIADEHRATATTYRLLGQLGPHFRHRGRRRGSIIVGTAEGDMHAIPTAILSDLLSDRRFDVTDLGANTPAESFLDAARSMDDLVGIGVCVLLDEYVESALAILRMLRAELPDVFLVVGGPAVHGASQATFANLANIVSTSAEDACDAFDRRVAADPAVSDPTVADPVLDATGA